MARARAKRPAMPDFIEDRHELKVAKRVVDVRPWSTKAAEWLTDPFHLLLASVPLLLAMNMFPFFALIPASLVVTMVVAHRRTKPLIPLRYPAMNPEPDPRTGKKGDGILLFGNLRSSSPYEKFKEVWGSDDSARRHMLIIGSTGSGKSETLKGIFFNSLAWSSGFFIADGKADNKLPTDTFTMARSFGREDDLLFLNFLLGGRTPEQVRRSRRRRTNKINPFSSADADTIIQMGANMLPKVEGEGKNWQEKALNLWRALVVALCYKRDTNGMDVSVATFLEYMALPMIEQLYIEGYDEAEKRGGEWSYGYIGIKSYLDTGCPAYKVDKLLAKHGRGDGPPQGPPGRPAAGKQYEQDSMAYEQHSYRTNQLMPVLNLLDKTYGYIFRDKYPEIDMVDVALNDRILCMLIPSLEKSAQEAENLGKLAIAALRVMMGRNLGSEIEGLRSDLIDSKATNAPYPYVVALDELAYYFADGIAVMFAQARSLGMSMIAAAQDLEKLTEGQRASEAGAMLANQVTKIFMRIDDAKKTFEMISTILGKVKVAVRRNYERGSLGWRHKAGEVDVEEVERASLQELQNLGPGQALINAEGKTSRISTFYVGNDLAKYASDSFFVPRFLQVRLPLSHEVQPASTHREGGAAGFETGKRLLGVLNQSLSRDPANTPEANHVIESIRRRANMLAPSVTAAERAVLLYQAAKAALMEPQQDAMDGAAAGSMNAGTTARRESGGEKGQVAPFADDVLGDLIEHGAEATKEAMKLAGAGRAAPHHGEPSEQTLHPETAQEEDILSFLDVGQTFRRKPTEQIHKPQPQPLQSAQSRQGGDRPTNPGKSHPGLVMDDPIQALLANGRFLTLPVAGVADVSAAQPSSRGEADVGISPAELLAAGLSDRPAPPPEPQVSALAEAQWIEAAMESARQISGAPSTPQEKTAVGFTDLTLARARDCEEALGSPNPQQSAERLESVVSAGVTPVTTPETPLDDAALDAFFDDMKERGL
jgi:intracellular multiplication protein IcmO